MRGDSPDSIDLAGKDGGYACAAHARDDTSISGDATPFGGDRGKDPIGRRIRMMATTDPQMRTDANVPGLMASSPS